MIYNFIKEIRKGKFSWEEDKMQTYKDLSKIYRIIGLEKIINKLEKRFGELEFKDKIEIESVYLLGTCLESVALYCGLTHEPRTFHYAAMGGLCYALCLLHHKKMGVKR